MHNDFVPSASVLITLANVRSLGQLHKLMYEAARNPDLTFDYLQKVERPLRACAQRAELAHTID